MKRTFIKKGIFTCIAAIIGIASSFAQTITTGTVEASVCAGSSISVPFTTTGTVGTDFKVQLSDASGAFTAPVEIGSGTASPVTARIDASTAAGTGYKVRVITSSPSIIGSASTAFRINEKPAAPTGSDFYRLCVGGAPVQLTATGQNLKWYAYDGQGGVNPLSAAPTINPTGSSAPVTPSYYVTQTINGCEGSKLDISVAVSLQTPMPTVTNPAPVCQNSSVTSSILTGAVGSSTNFIWYESLTGPAYTSVPVPSTAIAGTKDYYVSEVASRSCESARAKVTVTVLPAPAAPTVTSPVNYTVGDTPKALPTASDYIWYTSATGGSGTGIAPTPSTATAGTTSYFVGQKSGDCDGPRSEIKVVVTAAAACTPPAAPVVTSPVNVTVGQTATLTATAISGATLNWYGTSATGGTATATPPTVSTAAVGSTTYYVSQIIGTCESPRSAIVVNVAAACTVPAAPVVTSPVNVTVGQTVTLTATAISGATLKWYGTNQTGGTASSTAPTVSTVTVGTTTYYVSQIVETCESPRSAIVVNVAAAACTTPAAPVVTSPVNVTIGQTVTLMATAITGATLNWYETNATGGTATATPPTVSTTTVGSTTYYVSQMVGTCESPRSAIVVNVAAAACTTPAAPVVTSPVNVTVGQTATLTATAITGATLKWYGTSATGGTATATSPTISTTAVGTTTYYVSQIIGTCESPRSAIVVIVAAAACTPPAAPAVTSPVNVTVGQTVTLTATALTGATLKWYGTSATGGTATATPPTVSTATAGSTTYYVSQTVGTCESPRSAIVVNVAAAACTAPAAPVVTSPVNVTVGQTVTLTATALTGATLKWYGINASGGTATATPPMVLTTTVGSTTYYVSQTVGTCESPRAAIVVNVSAAACTPPAAPITQDYFSYCVGAKATQLTAQGTNLKWYGGDGITVLPNAPTPATTTAHNALTPSFYVTQTINGCESPKAPISINVNAISPTPIVTNPDSICQGTVLTSRILIDAITPGGVNYLWYKSDGTSSTTAPVPSSATPGAQDFYVTQTNSRSCESLKAKITVTIVARPIAPTIVAPKIPIEYCQSVQATALTTSGATGSVLWYTVATGGTGVSSIIPSTAAEGTTSYYVEQTVNGCTSPRASVAVKINVTPPPTVATPSVAYCQNETATALVATGSNLKWYLGKDDTDFRTTALIPFTEKVSDYSFYVTQTGTNTCESAKAEIKVHIKPLPSAIISGSSSIGLGGTATITINFTGDGPWTYILSNGVTATTNSATVSVPVSPLITTTYVVTEVSNACGKGIPNGSALVTVQVPTLTIGVPSVSALCAGKTFTVPLQQSGSFPEGSSMKVQISTVNETAKFVSVPSVLSGNVITATIPDTTVKGTYYIRVANIGKDGALVSAGNVSTGQITVNPLPVATITGATTIYLGATANLKVDLTGDAPWTFSVNNGTSDSLVSTSVNPITLRVSPKTTTTYRITTVSNQCGSGRGAGSARIQVDPVLGTEPPVVSADWLKIYPTLIDSKCTVEITSVLSAKDADIEILDLNGRSLYKKSIRQKITEVDFSQRPGGLYLLKVKNGKYSSVQRIFKR